MLDIATNSMLKAIFVFLIYKNNQMTREVNDSPRIIYLLEGDLEAIIARGVSEAISKLKFSGRQEPKIVYGLDGIAEVLGCCKSTVLRIKRSGALDGYISQVGKTIAGYEDKILEGAANYYKREKDKKASKQPRKITLR